LKTGRQQSSEETAGLEVMRGSKKYYVTLFQMGPASVGAVLLIGLATLVLSCDEAGRHQMLTFFFDGVPPTGPQNAEQQLARSNLQELQTGEQKPTWYSHEPIKNCLNCHQKQRTGRFSTQTRLIAQPPKLCYKCHSDFTTSAPYVHGPVAVGQCLFCHNPHRSKNKHLLNQPEPKLCFLCHDSSMIELIPAHLTQQTSACTDCHNPHAAWTKALLKGASSQTNGAGTNGKKTGATEQEKIQRTKEPAADVTSGPSEPTDKAAMERKNLFELFGQVSRLIEQGDMKKARAQLEALKDNKTLTADEREKILNVLKLMDKASSEPKQQSEKDKQGKPLTQRRPNASGANSEKSGDSMTQQERAVADLYYRSMAFYRDGQLQRARDGFVEVLKSGLIPDPMAKTIRGYVSDINRRLAGDKTPPPRGK
jgi:predicted CXXCH cytochrome family protein